MTPTQWLAIPTEIRLTDLPSLINASHKNKAEACYLNGTKVMVKQEVVEPTETNETTPSTVYLHPVVTHLKRELQCLQNDAHKNINKCELAEHPSASSSSSSPSSSQDGKKDYDDSSGAKNQLLMTEEGGARLTLECHTPTLTDAIAAQLQQGNIIIVTSSKPKNSDYKVQGFTLATKRNRPVNFKLLQAKPGVQLFVSLTYQGHIYGDEPVKRCKKHDECSWCKDHKFNEAFCIISKFHRYELDPTEKPVAILTPEEEHLDADGSVEFSVVFACWNSCDIHQRFGKVMTLHINVTHNREMKKVEYTIHCCENLGRDAFKDKKRKLLSQAGNTQENPSKGITADSNTFSTSSSSSSTLSRKTPKMSKATSTCPPTSPPTSPTTTKKEEVDIVVEGLDEDKRDLVERLVRTIGGYTYRIPHLVRLTTQHDASQCKSNGTK